MVLLTHILTVLSSLLLLPGVFGVKFHGNHTALEEVAGRKVLAIACPQAHPNVNETAVSLLYHWSGASSLLFASDFPRSLQAESPEQYQKVC